MTYNLPIARSRAAQPHLQCYNVLYCSQFAVLYLNRQDIIIIVRCTVLSKCGYKAIYIYGGGMMHANNDS